MKELLLIPLLAGNPMPVPYNDAITSVGYICPDDTQIRIDHYRTEGIQNVLYLTRQGEQMPYAMLQPKDIHLNTAIDNEPDGTIDSVVNDVWTPEHMCNISK